MGGNCCGNRSKDIWPEHRVMYHWNASLRISRYTSRILCRSLEKAWCDIGNSAIQLQGCRVPDRGDALGLKDPEALSA